MSEEARKNRSATPTGGSMGERLESLLDSILERHFKGERPSISEYVEKNPELAERLRDVFPALALLGGLPRPASGASGASQAESDERAGEAPSTVEVRRLGEYRLIREVGRGGMGVVYEAEQEPLGRRVALKVLPFHSLMDPRRIERFRREARAAAGLQHPGIVPVYGVGEEGGIHFYAMQFVEGESLEAVLFEVKRWRSGESPSAPGSRSSELARQLLRDSTSTVQREAWRVVAPPAELEAPSTTSGSMLPAARREPSGKTPPEYYRGVARLGWQVAVALGYAHGRGVLHRDIKPANLLLDLKGTVWIADFGLAKAADTEELTQTGEIVGTLRYMAPEQLEGQADARSDVYSLGLTLYELLTLEPALPERKKRALSRNLGLQPPLRLRKLDPGIPRALETIVLNATRKEPEERYQSATEMEADLERFLNSHPVRARLPRPGHRLKVYLKGHWLALGLVVLLAALLTVAIPLGTRLKRPRNPECLLVTDLDGDRDSDFVTVNSGSNSISFLLNDGSGAFTVGAHVAVGEIPLSAVALDLDGDRDVDLAVASNGGAELRVFRNLGTGAFEEAARISLGVGSNYLAAADFDGDLRADLAITVRSNNVYILRNLGNLAFVRSDSPETVRIAGNLASADLDNDGDQDLLCSYPGQDENNNLSVFVNNGSGKFLRSRDYDLGGGAWDIRPADLDADGDLDLAVAFDALPRIAILLNDGGGGFSKGGYVPLNSLSRSITAADFDGDSDLDLACAGGEGSYVCILKNTGKGNFDLPFDLIGGDKPQWIEAFDLDGDGDLDLAEANFRSNDISLFFNDGNGNFNGGRRVELFTWLRPRLLSNR